MNKVFIKKLAITGALTILIFFLLIMLTAVASGVYAYRQWHVFSKAADISGAELQSILQEGWFISPKNTDSHKNILLLGTDTLETRGGSPPLTDTIMLISLNLKTGEAVSLSLPRDLWHEQYQTKINALYYYGHERNPEKPEEFPRQTLEELLGIPIHHTMVLSMEKVAQLVDLLGGLEIDVANGFTDNKFPRTDVDVTSETDPEKLFKTISFDPGRQLMSGERVLEYIRSRNSEGDEGDDLARAKRQQQVIEALITTLKNKSTLRDAKKMGALFGFYLENFSKYLPAPELIAIGKSLGLNLRKIEFSAVALSLYPENEAGVIWHPDTRLYNQWVYAIKDQTAFQTEARIKLGILNELAQKEEDENI
jgi:LCP family protein required for cell wall assembly